jgi:hypothetical protein
VEKEVFEIAKNIQDICDTEDICPENIHKWDKVDGKFTCQSSVGGLVKYSVLYGVNEEKSEFFLTLRLNIDNQLYYHGGIGKQIKRGR